MLLSPVAGVLVDRFDRKRLLLLSNWLRAGVVLLLILTTTGPQWLWAVYLLTICQFTLSSVYEPGLSALIPTLVRGDDLVTANTLGNITWSAMLAIGAAVGGLVSSLVGANVALILDAASFVLAAVLVMGIRMERFKAVQPASHEPKTDTSFREGLRYLRRNRQVAATLLIKFGTSLGNIDTLMTIFATQVFILGTDGQLSLGIMYSAFGFGAIIGPLILNRFNDGSVSSMRRLVIVGLALAVLGWFVLSNAWSLLAVCAGLFTRAMGGSANWTYSTVMIQKLVPDAYLGRMFSIDMAFFYLSTVLSTVIHGTLVDRLGAEHIRTIAIGTALVGLIPLVGWVWFTRRVRQKAESVALSSS
jgi:MFS family permease